MAENVRDVIRSAQAAEVAGDKPRAIELLRQAASLYQRAGNLVRAQSLLRYALKLDPSRFDVQAELDRLEALSGEGAPASAPMEVLREAEVAVSARVDPISFAVETLRASVLRAEELARQEVMLSERRAGGLVAASAPPPEGEGAFVERGPTRADPSLEAWCSFCCRPRSEVGSLIAGPAGAFICSACISESGALLGGVSMGRPPVSAPRAPASFPLLGQEVAQASLARALEAGVRRLLLIGPEGSGKSTWMRQLEEEGRGVRVSPDALEQAPFEALLLVEDVDRLSPEAQASLVAFLARHGERSVLLSARGAPASSELVLRSDSGRLPVLSTASLSQSVQGSLPVALLEQVQHLVSLEAPSVPLLVELARRELALRARCSLSDEALTALATEASRSPRTGHELQALLARVPPGSWLLEAPRRGRAKPKPRPKQPPKKARPAGGNRRKGTS